MDNTKAVGSSPTPYTLIERLRKRAEIRRQIATRKSVQEGKPDRLADLLEEAANRIQYLELHEQRHFNPITDW